MNERRTELLDEITWCRRRAMTLDKNGYFDQAERLLVWMDGCLAELRELDKLAGRDAVLSMSMNGERTTPVSPATKTYPIL